MAAQTLLPSRPFSSDPAKATQLQEAQVVAVAVVVEKRGVLVVRDLRTNRCTEPMAPSFA